ncbi:MAG TPA: Ni/Fe hydrogenase subunit alpha [Thermoflexia bacterium]|jgi:coenzyme F420-reducing hydrogenase alpha subunit|nr:Ni/Fe hydrogenase subunit alpha [Thermoflexia bacterium]
MSGKKIEVHHVTRVEGHGNIVVDIKNGEIKECRFEVVEAPRFFEAFVRGRPYYELSHITSRICGICAVGHATTSLRATEKAFSVELSEQAWLLRKLNFHGEMIDSHVLHTYYLVAPDFFGVHSVIPLVETHREVVERALRIKKLSGDLCAMIGGRHTHPIALTVGGFTHTPTERELREIQERLIAARADMDVTVDLFATLPWPEFERETEYVSLHKDDEYAFIDGTIVTSDGFSYPIEDYKKVTNEHCVPFSTAKWTKHNRDSYMVGALARLNNNFDQLHPRAKEAAKKLGLKPLVTNPFLNTAAQVVEMVHCVEDSIRIIDELLTRGIKPEEPPVVEVKAGEGVGACEVPRGVLFHHYVYDEEGRCTEANCIIPTNQNMANLNADMQALVPQILDRPQEEIRHLLEMLVRAYDPCISCSTHFLTVEFV